MKKIINSIILTFFVIDNISAQLDNNESMEKAGTAAAQFLKIPFDSKTETQLIRFFHYLSLHTFDFYSL